MIDRYTIHTHSSDNLDRLAQFILRYSKAYPDAKLMASEFYTYHPALNQGRNVLCALDAEQRIWAFAPLFPVPLPPGCEEREGSAPAPHHIWTILLADPELDEAAEVRQLLFARLLEHARGIQASFPSERPTRLASDMMASQKPDIAFLKGKGFQHYNGMYVMRRSKDSPIPGCDLPVGLTLRRWKLASELEQRQYLQAFNRCFPELPKTLEALRFLLDSPMWVNGTAVAAFDRLDNLVASILVYPNNENTYGILDDVFVLPELRGQGIAKALIAAGLRHWQSQGLQEVFLEVKKDNVPAVSVYRAMGFEIVNEEVLLGLIL